ncbi:MAG: flagellar hook-length control protein FliK, partial [Moorella sp. (in: Bacteria)]|nr:flagellar hook-length control protein FliK [Moorella sp. (in: firmicutes)]
SLEGGRLVLHLLVENLEAARALQLAVPEMRQAVAGQGLRLEQVQVQVGSGGQSHDYPAGDRGEYRQGSPEWQRGALPGDGHQGRETAYSTWYRLDYLA